MKKKDPKKNSISNIVVIIIILIFVIFILGHSLGSLLYNYSFLRDTINKFCYWTGGEQHEHSSEYDCAWPAKDADKSCTYNDECNTGICEYPIKYDSEIYGKIDFGKYITVPDNYGKCTKWKGLKGNWCDRERGQDVSCGLTTS